MKRARGSNRTVYMWPLRSPRLISTCRHEALARDVFIRWLTKRPIIDIRGTTGRGYAASTHWLEKALLVRHRYAWH